MTQAPLIKRGKYYFCSECGKLMTRPRKSCPTCRLQFTGEIVEDKIRPPQDPDKMAEVEERYEEIRSQSFFWIGIGVVLFLGTVAVVLLILLRH